MAGEIAEIAKKLREIVERLEALTNEEKQPDPLAAEMDVAEAEWRGKIERQKELQAKVTAQNATAEETLELKYMPEAISYAADGIANICFKQYVQLLVKTDEDGCRLLYDLFVTTRNLRYLATVKTTDVKRRASVADEMTRNQSTIAQDTNLLKTKAVADPQAVVDSFFAWLKDTTTEQQVSGFRAGRKGAR